MTITLNGQYQNLPVNTTIAELLVQLNLHPEAVVVEINTTIVERIAFETRRLTEGDRIEIIRFVGGG